MAPTNASSQRKFASDIYRPVGNKIVSTGNAGLAGASPAAVQLNLNGQVDLSTPLRGFRFVIKGRVAVATANYTSVNPESILNLVSKIRVVGTNSRQGGNVTLVDMDLATLFAIQFLNQEQAGFVQVNGVQQVRPGAPPVAAVALTTAGSPYDFIIVVDLPFAPFGIQDIFETGFLMRDTEYTNAVNFHIEFPAVPDNAQNPLGLSAATTVTTISSFGSGAGAMTVDIYELPVIMGSSRNTVVPGILTRSLLPIGAVLSASNPNVLLTLLEKQATPRIYIKVGTATAPPTFLTLSDAIVTALGLQVGTDRNVRNLVDIYAVKADTVGEYDVPHIQGYAMLDFVNKRGNFDSAYPGDKLGPASTLRLIANITTAANAAAFVMQEQIIQHPQGSLFG